MYTLIILIFFPDINTDTVTFKSQESSLMFEDVTLASSNTSEIVFSFRTHSSDALLLYASFQEEGDLVMMKIELVNGSKVVFTMISPVKEETAELRVPGMLCRLIITSNFIRNRKAFVIRI